MVVYSFWFHFIYQNQARQNDNPVAYKQCKSFWATNGLLTDSQNENNYLTLLV